MDASLVTECFLNIICSGYILNCERLQRKMVLVILNQTLVVVGMDCSCNLIDCTFCCTELVRKRVRGPYGARQLWGPAVPGRVHIHHWGVARIPVADHHEHRRSLRGQLQLLWQAGVWATASDCKCNFLGFPCQRATASCTKQWDTLTPYSNSIDVAVG